MWRVHLLKTYTNCYFSGPRGGATPDRAPLAGRLPRGALRAGAGSEGAPACGRARREQLGVTELIRFELILNITKKWCFPKLNYNS